MAEPPERLWTVLTDYALTRWLEGSRPTREQVRSAFDWTVTRVHAGPESGPWNVSHNGDAVRGLAFRSGAGVVLLYDVYHPTRTIAVMEFKSS